MAPVVLWTLVALGTAVVVMVVAVSLTAEGGLRQLARDLRSGLRKDARRELFTDLRADDEDDAGSVESLFELGRPTDRAHLGGVPVQRGRQDELTSR